MILSGLTTLDVIEAVCDTRGPETTSFCKLWVLRVRLQPTVIESQIMRLDDSNTAQSANLKQPGSVDE